MPDSDVADEAATPADGADAPATDAATPADGADAPATDAATPADGAAANADVAASPADGAAANADVAAAPADGAAANTDAASGFEGKVAVVTGAASGLGRAIADRFGAAGCRLVLADVEEAPLAQAAAELAAAGADVTAVRTDVADAAAMDALGETVRAHHGAPDLLFNNAGVGIEKATADMTTRDWRWILGVNLWGVIHGLRVFLPEMLARNAGHIINTASSAGHVVFPRLAAYSASKHAVVAITETVQAELEAAESNVRISALCPGMVRTRITSSERNRPEPLRNPGDAPPVADNWDEKMSAGRQAELESRFGRALLPAAVADMVFDGVAAGDFYIWTDDLFADGLRQRHTAIQDSLEASTAAVAASSDGRRATA